MHSPLRCDLHDYLEIACMFGYDVKLTLLSDDTVSGKATNISVNEDRQEQLILAAQSNSSEFAIPLVKLKSMHVLTPNARFQQVNFQDSY